MFWSSGVDAHMLRQILENQGRIERKLDALLAAFEIETQVPKVSEVGPFGLDADRVEQIRQHLREGNKIAAIKQLRLWTDLGLAEAKNAVESGQF